MTRARDPEKRLRQVVNWLRANYPTSLPVRLVIAPIKQSPGETCPAYTTRTKRGFDIRLDRVCFEKYGEDLTEDLIHEWAHAWVWRDERAGDEVFDVHHDAEWGVAFATIYSAYFDEGGCRDADEMPTR